MKKSFIYWLRWILAIPSSIIVGSIINLLLLGFFSIFLAPSVIDIPLNNFVFPLVIGFVLIQIGSKIAPKYNFKTAIILFGILFFLEIGIFLITPLSEGVNPIIKAIMSLIGGIAGLFFVKRGGKKYFLGN